MPVTKAVQAPPGVFPANPPCCHFRTVSQCWWASPSFTTQLFPAAKPQRFTDPSSFVVKRSDTGISSALHSVLVGFSLQPFASSLGIICQASLILSSGPKRLGRPPSGIARSRLVAAFDSTAADRSKHENVVHDHHDKLSNILSPNASINSVRTPTAVLPHHSCDELSSTSSQLVTPC